VKGPCCMSIFDKAKETASDLKDKASDMMGSKKDSPRDSSVGDKAKDMAQEAKGKAEDVVDELKDRKPGS
jgi:ElaB/YqjD/DUF883 family membrane-anchored ribosome-binding protein